MHPQLQIAYARIEKEKHLLLDELSKISLEDLNKNPSPGKWSISQVIAHLIAAERLSLLYMKKKIQGIDTTADSGVLEEMKMLVLKMSQRMPLLKFKAPRVVVDHTKAYSDFLSLKNEWDKLREDLRQFLERIDDHHMKRRIYKHAAVGYLNVRHAVLFFGEHVTHHRPQIKKLIALAK